MAGGRATPTTGDAGTAGRRSERVSGGDRDRSAAPAWSAPSSAYLLLLQRAAGNRAVGSYLHGRPPGVRVQRQPAPSTAIVHDGQQLVDDGPAVQATIEKVVVERGWGGAEVWASAFYNAEPTSYLRYHPDADYVKRVAARLKGEMEIKHNAVKQLTGTPTLNLGDVVIGQGDFDRWLHKDAQSILDNSEKQLKAQAERYGLKVSGWVFKDYTMTVGPEQQKLQAEATKLAQQRDKCDTGRFTFERLQKQADAMGRQFDLSQAMPGVVSAEDAARTAWIKLEDDYHATCQVSHAQYPVLAAYTSLNDAAAQLRDIGTESTTKLAERLYKAVDERIKNIGTVREQLDGALNLWLQPQLVALTKASSTLPPWQNRVIDDTVRTMRRDQAQDEKVWTVLAIGLGLLAALPTGGGSVALAGLAAAGAALGAAYSMNTLYQHYKDYTLASAASGTNLDKAQAISADDPSLTWLAFDLLDLGLNVIGAAAAFKTLKGALAAAEAGGAAALPKLFTAADEIGLTAASKGRLAKVALNPRGGPRAVEEMLAAIKAQIAKAGPGADADFIAACKKAATTAIDEGKVGFIRSTKGQTLNEVERLLRNAGEVEPEVGRLARMITKQLAQNPTTGLYLQKFDVILIREGDDVGNVLIHELTHRAQNYERKMFQIGAMRREYQAYHAEREFLRALPPDLVPEHAKEIWQATDAGLEAHIAQEYAGEIADEILLKKKFKALDPSIDGPLALEWFKNLARFP